MRDSLQPDQTPPRVLVVDDDPLFCGLLYDALSPVGCIVETAASGEEAGLLLAEVPVDLVILDLVLPGMNGLQLLHDIRRRYPDLDVILATAHGSIDSSTHAIQLGAVDYLTKPVHLGHLRTLVMKTIEIGKLRRALQQARGALAAAYVDHETGLYTRPLFLELVQSELRVASCCNQPLSLVVIALSEPVTASTASHALRQAIRPHDRLGRLDATHIAIAMPDTTSIDILLEQDRLRHLVQQAVGAAPITIGSATYPSDASDLHTLIATAAHEAALAAMSSDQPYP